jgi:hypothetical protein
MSSDVGHRCTPRLIEGKHALTVLIAIGLIGAAISWSYYRRLQRRSLALWGPQAAELMLRAPRAEAWRLETAEHSDDRDIDLVELDGKRFFVQARVDVSHAPGIIHLRHSLINDHSFDWSSPQVDGQPRWDYALRFVEDEAEATLLVSLNRRLVKLAGGERMATLAKGWNRLSEQRGAPPPLERFLLDQFSQAR